MIWPGLGPLARAPAASPFPARRHPDLYSRAPRPARDAPQDELHPPDHENPTSCPAMPDTEGGHHRGDAAVARQLDLVAPPAAPATTSSSRATTTATATATARHDDEEEDGFTFAAVAVPCPVYAVFGRPRWSPQKQRQQEEEEEEEGPAGTGAATARRVPLGRLLLEERWCDDGAPSVSGKQPADAAEAELDGVPAETYCLWSPASPAAGSSRRASPARCRTRGSAGLSVLRWQRQRRVAAGKDKFVFLAGAGEGHGSAARGGGKSTTTTFLPWKQDLVGLVASAITFRPSCQPF
jgi:hypothetical protein|uniref:DUF1645 family protein n=2 Tax=Zea mays TaxID=4577 RepID=A0A804Q2M4_MAIZE|eukprot:XP_023156159.1 uncharacterized protein LOC111589541 [Zea mays]